MNTRAALPPQWLLSTALAAGVLLAAQTQAGDLDSARRFVEQRSFEHALPLYEQLLAQHPRDDDLLIETARVYGFADRNAESAHIYQRALEVAPQRRADILPSLAWQSLWSGDATYARELFEELSQGSGDRIAAATGLGESCEHLGDLPCALEAYGLILDQQPDNRHAAKLRARTLLWMDRYVDAERAYRDVIASDPTDTAARIGLARTLNFGGRHREAIASYESLDHEVQPSIGGELARAYYWAGLPEQAMPLLEAETDADLAWLRSYRVHRELRSYAGASVDASSDSDKLDRHVLSLRAGLSLHHGRVLEVVHAAGSLTGDVPGQGRRRFHIDSSSLTTRWRVGNASSPLGIAWPSVTLSRSDYGNWQPMLWSAGVKWLPLDLLHIDASGSREAMETAHALDNEVLVDTLLIGSELRLPPRWTASATFAHLRFDDGNLRNRTNLRAEFVARFVPRLAAGIETQHFVDSRPTGPGRESRGYYSPRRYGEYRAYLSLSHEIRPWDFMLKVGSGLARETDGLGGNTIAHPKTLEVAVARDFGSDFRMQAYAGGSGSSFGVTTGASGYSRQYVGLALTGWF